jgi:hypothetical protein
VKPAAVDTTFTRFGTGTTFAEDGGESTDALTPANVAVTVTVLDPLGATPVTVTGNTDPTGRPNTTFPTPPLRRA